MKDEIMLSDTFDHVYKEIIDLIKQKKGDVKNAVNDTMLSLYWGIGKKLTKEITGVNKPEYGKRVVIEISKRLSVDYGTGFDKSAISRMINFYQKFPNYEKVAALSQQMTWSHFIELLPIKDELKREFYAAMCKNENWSVRTLRERKKSMLYERTAISKRPDETIKNEIAELSEEKKMSLDMFYRDPYMLDFLGLKDTYSEKDLENAILVQLEKFILEMGSDFAFLARQKHFVLDGKDYYMDLLFFHRTLRRLVLIELKLGEFEPQDKGQVELYLRWLEKYERAEGEEKPVALILCAEKSQETVELMELDNGSIHVAQYLTKMPPKEILEKKLLLAIANAKEQLEQRENN
ncbi:MAG: PDDEXK nuclease domain-containing protein [Lachnospiraceae bacterium]|nr:PDDEXK nuclease domain-containing protein [Lachnospiraceae bacterium]